MRIAVISDVHANIKKLEKGLEDISIHSPDEIWCLGDLVGYGSEPKEVVSQIRSSCDLSLAGNHDYAATERFPEFLDAIPAWLKGSLTVVKSDLSESDYDWLKDLRPVAAKPEENISLCHGSPSDPVMEFLNEDVGRELLPRQDAFLQLVGHTHRPLALGLRHGKQMVVYQPEDKDEIDLTAESKWILNPGALGLRQFREVKDRRSGWMLLDFNKDFQRATWFRID